LIFSCSQDREVEEKKEVYTQPIQWDEFIDFREGNIPLLIISVHGGDIEPEWIKTRSCDGATVVRDSHTLTVAKLIESELKGLGYSPYIVLNDLHRKKLDLNRSLNNSNCGDQTTKPYWNLFHNQIDEFRTKIQNKYGVGLVIDIHGQSHVEQHIELGYLLSSSQLRNNSSFINSIEYKNRSSIKNLLNNHLNNLNFTDLLSGEFSMGSYLNEKGYASVPSKEDIAPKEGELYFSGGFNTATYGSRDGGSVDAVQIELNMDGVRDSSENRILFSKEFAQVLLSYLRTHYNENL
jgi:N-formylglutamate amidohydrolase